MFLSRNNIVWAKVKATLLTRVELPLVCFITAVMSNQCHLVCIAVTVTMIYNMGRALWYYFNS